MAGKKGMKVHRDAEVPIRLRDLRWAYRHQYDAEEGREPGTPQQEDYRTRFRTPEKKEQMERDLDRLEKEYRSTQRGAPAPQQDQGEPVPASMISVVDEGSGRSEETVEKLLDQFEEGMNEAERLGSQLERRWFDLTEEQRKMVKQLIEGSPQ